MKGKQIAGRDEGMSEHFRRLHEIRDMRIVSYS
jgi:hypothetical protein